MEVWRVDWYALHVITGKELDIKRYLIEGGIDSFAPRRKLRERKFGEWQNVERILFPGYVFVKTNMHEKIYYKLTSVSGVINILKGASENPTPIDEEEMKLVFRFASDKDLVEISDIIFDDNQRIKVISGPLQGYEGNILKVERRRFRAKVNFTIAGKEKIVELGINVLDKV